MNNNFFKNWAQKDKYCMIPFIWNSQTGKTNLWREKKRIEAASTRGERIGWKRMQRTFWGNRNIFFKWDSVSMGVKIFQTSSDYTLKICAFFECKVYFSLKKNIWGKVIYPKKKKKKAKA